MAEEPENNLNKERPESEEDMRLTEELPPEAGEIVLQIGKKVSVLLDTEDFSVVEKLVSRFDQYDGVGNLGKIELSVVRDLMNECLKGIDPGTVQNIEVLLPALLRGYVENYDETTIGNINHSLTVVSSMIEGLDKSDKLNKLNENGKVKEDYMGKTLEFPPDEWKLVGIIAAVFHDAVKGNSVEFNAHGLKSADFVKQVKGILEKVGIVDHLAVKILGDPEKLAFIQDMILYHMDEVPTFVPKLLMSAYMEAGKDREKVRNVVENIVGISNEEIFKRVSNGLLVEIPACTI